MAIQNTTFRVYVEKLGASEATDFIGNEGDLFYDPNTTVLRISDGTTPGGVTLSTFNTPQQPAPGPGIGTGDIVGTLNEINVLDMIGGGHQISLPQHIQLAGTLNVAGITTVNSDMNIAGKARAVKFSTVSDERLKTNIKRIDNPLDLISSIEGVTFDWLSDGSHDVGLIAQDVERCLPAAVMENEGTKSVNYNGVIGLLVEAVKELSSENRLLRMEVSSIKEKI